MADMMAVRIRLMRMAQRDAHARGDGKYLIRSIYFDNPYDTALFEKLDGVRRRDKYRIRFYNMDTSYIRLEKKSKLDDMSTKSCAPLTTREARMLIEGSYDFLLDKKEPVLLELYADMRTKLLRPKTIVDYTREAFLYKPGNVRVTFDTDIRSGIVSTSVFSKDVATAPVLAPGTLMMEVKFDEFLPEIVASAIQTGNTRRQAFSKYAACRKFG